MAHSPYDRRPASPARVAAWFALRRVHEPMAPGLDVLLREQAEREKLDDIDKGLARELAFGVMRQRRWLESILARYMQSSLAEFVPAAHEALLMGAYQLAFLERVPPHSAVDESVRLVASMRDGYKLRGLTNAVLRKVAREPRSALQPANSAEPWPVRHSVPDWLAEEARKVLPAESDVEAYFAASNRPAPLCLRPVGPFRTDIAGFEARLRGELARATAGEARMTRGKLVPDSFLVDGAQVDPMALELFREGKATVEDEGAHAAALVGGARGTERHILDLCASPGGKTLHLCERAHADAEILACDVSKEKLARLRDTLQRVKLESRAKLGFSEDILASKRDGRFDLILVDAPCSGLGTLRRHPEARWRRSAESVAECAARQGELLDRSARLVAPGGVLSYSICTFTHAEGEAVREAFLAAHPEFGPTVAPEGLPFDPARLEVSRGFWRTWAHRDGCDAFTVMRFVRL